MAWRFSELAIVHRSRATPSPSFLVDQARLPPFDSGRWIHVTQDSAGAKRMPLLPFVALTAAGSFLWNLLLVSSGYWLGDRWGQTAAVSHWANIGVVVAGLAAAIWWLKGLLGRTVDA